MDYLEREGHKISKDSTLTLSFLYHLYLSTNHRFKRFCIENIDMVIIT